jgi:ADP-heptose:LPS heptosyltransferase
LPGAASLAGAEYVCIHPGASVPERRWPAEHFAAVARALARQGLRIVLTGSSAEIGLAEQVSSLLEGPALSLAGRTDLGFLAALLHGARLLVCNDTGVSHVADAVGCPSVVLSTGDNPARWSPQDGRRHRVLCREEGVPPDEVIVAAEDLLRQLPSRRSPSPGIALAGSPASR